MFRWVKDVCVCVCCVQWEYADQVGETLMLSVFDNIECCKQLPAIPWFHHSSHAVPKHYVTLHLISTLSHFIHYLLLNAFVHLSTFGTVGICVFHMEVALWVDVSTLEIAVQNLCLPHGTCILGYKGVSSSWWREKQCSGSVKKQARGWRWGAKGGESITCACLFVPFRQPLCFNYPFLSQGASIPPLSMHHIPHTLHRRTIRKA